MADEKKESRGAMATILAPEHRTKLVAGVFVAGIALYFGGTRVVKKSNSLSYADGFRNGWKAREVELEDEDDLPELNAYDDGAYSG